MAKKEIRKIIYFDKETIQNILQELDSGELSKTTDFKFSVDNNGNLDASTEISLDVPFIKRLSFMLTGKIETSYLLSRESTTTISSTEISEFERLKSSFVHLPNVQIYDIENSSTSLRVAGGYLKIVKGGVDGLDTDEFKTVMDSYDGYDTYKVDDNRYVRFNNSAFVSNYKRNDLLTTTMTLYCIPVGEFAKERFDFMEEMNRMERLISTASQRQSVQEQSLAEYYSSSNKTHAHTPHRAKRTANQKQHMIQLYDVVYACIEAGRNSGR